MDNVYWGGVLYQTSLIAQKHLLSARDERLADLNYLAVGDGGKPTIVFIHGLGDVKENYMPSGFFLRQNYHLIIPDVPSFGDSSREPDKTYTLDYFSSRLLEFLQALRKHKNIDKIHLVGHSLGGAIACTMALEEPSFLRSLSLVNSGGFYWESIHSFYHYYLAGINFLRVTDRKEFQTLLSKTYHRPPYIPEPLLSFVLHNALSSAEWNAKICDDLIGGSHLSKKDIERVRLNDRIKKLDLPTLILWGRHDGLFPVECALKLHGLLKNSRLHILEKCAHVPMRERRQKFARTIADFVSGYQ